MTLAEQERLQARMLQWAALSPEERAQVRERYRMLQEMPPERREEIRRKWQEYDSLTEEEKDTLRQAHPKPRRRRSRNREPAARAGRPAGPLRQPGVRGHSAGAGAVPRGLPVSRRWPRTLAPVAAHTVFQAWLVVVCGGYFVYCWVKGGRTLAMKTWHLKLAQADGAAGRLAARLVALRARRARACSCSGSATGGRSSTATGSFCTTGWPERASTGTDSKAHKGTSTETRHTGRSLVLHAILLILRNPVNPVNSIRLSAIAARAAGSSPPPAE